MISWQESPSAFGQYKFDFHVMNDSDKSSTAFRYPCVIAFGKHEIGVYDFETGTKVQTIAGSNIRLLFTNTQPSMDLSESNLSGPNALFVSGNRVLALTEVASGAAISDGLNYKQAR
jgi:hypothetical protein